jgi:hypothetical protein
MTAKLRLACAMTLLSVLAPGTAAGTEPDAPAGPATTFAVTGFYYAMRDQPDFGVGVASLDHGSLHLEGRYNYEARDSGSVFAGWKFAGGDTVTFAVTPIVGALFGSARGVVPGVEVGVAYGPFDAYIEAEYVRDLDQQSASYYYAWSELAWKPAQWLRIGLVGQRTHEIENGRDLQRGAFAQLIIDKVTLGVYAFNPDSASRYVIVSLGALF